MTLILNMVTGSDQMRLIRPTPRQRKYTPKGPGLNYRQALAILNPDVLEKLPEREIVQTNQIKAGDGVRRAQGNG